MKVGATLSDGLPLAVIVPVGPYHLDIAERAVASVLAQTVPCRAVVVYDHEWRGAGWARNRGVEHVDTPFLSFLDSDDWLEPTFAEEMLRAYDGVHYVFSDWITDKVIEAPARPWAGDGTSHIVTTLLPTVMVRSIGGFDEQLPGGEDTEFAWNLTRNGFCGKRLARALVHYSDGGQRAHAFIHSPDYQTIMRGVVARYEGKPMPCQDCGGNPIDMDNPPMMGEQQPGDVLAEALWAGERPERGRITRRTYRGGWNSRLWMAPEDIDAAPNLFKRVVDMPPALGDDDFARLATTMQVGMGMAADRAKRRPLSVAPTSGVVAPDVANVLRLYANGAKLDTSAK